MANLAIPLISASRGDLDRTLRSLLTQSIRRSSKSREQIADDMSRFLAPRQITVNQLNQWTAPSHEGWRIPAAYVRAFCEATGDDIVLRFLIGSRLATLLRLGEMVARAVPSILSRFETRRTALVNSDDPQEMLFG